jgi:hypothetical protein
LDNASVNDVLVRALSRILRESFDIQFVPDNSQIRCLAHVVNLVVQKLLATLEEAVDPNIEDTYKDAKDLPVHYDPETDRELAEFEREVFQKKDSESTEEEGDGLLMAALGPEYEKLSPVQKVSYSFHGKAVSDTVNKLRKITVKICSSPQRRKRFRTTAQAVFTKSTDISPSGMPLSTLMVIRDVRHRWNYTEAMISRGILLRKVCCFLTVSHCILHHSRLLIVRFWTAMN